WKDSLHNFQHNWIALILDGQHVLGFTATGDGKYSLFIVPILVHLELSSSPMEYPLFPVWKHPVGLEIMPTKGLATSFTYMFPG
ncbi:hypothetical protein BDP27DRAFT_1230119, partial [Rhodocollybia butyracea]